MFWQNVRFLVLTIF